MAGDDYAGENAALFKLQVGPAATLWTCALNSLNLKAVPDDSRTHVKEL
jgi:hypothetical protein